MDAAKAAVAHEENVVSRFRLRCDVDDDRIDAIGGHGFYPTRSELADQFIDGKSSVLRCLGWIEDGRDDNMVGSTERVLISGLEDIPYRGGGPGFEDRPYGGVGLRFSQ